MNWRFLFRFKRKYREAEIDPDEIFLDSSNLPQFDTDQFEGRLERPLARRTINFVGFFFIIISVIFASKLWLLQINEGEAYALRSENNRLRQEVIFNERGIIYDRTGTELVWNELNEELLATNTPTTTDHLSAGLDQDFSLRRYSPLPGLAHVLGYIKYPAKDKYGVYYQTSIEGKAGVELDHHEQLAGSNGLRITENDALGTVVSESTIKLPQDGENLTLSIDALVQSKLHEFIAATAHDRGFGGGAGVIMDVNSGDVLAMTSFPEFDSNRLASGEDQDYIEKLFDDKSNPFLNRVIGGLYTPGSIIKIFMAISALQEKLIDPNRQILSTGSISIPNPYFPDQESVFVDWKAHGLVDMRKALAVSSNVYFYEIGGGFKDQLGLGIKRIEKYMRQFGFGSPTNISLTGETDGVIPSPEWKEVNFDGDYWRIGDTYHTVIGQYGFQVTPLQAVRAVAAVANDGGLLTPKIVLNEPIKREQLEIEPSNFQVAREGMRQAVLEGTAKGLATGAVAIAAKTGTAELGFSKQDVNSWVVGFFPYEKPRFAFAVVMEKGPRNNVIGGVSVMRQLVDWMTLNAPEYFE